MSLLISTVMGACASFVTGLALWLVLPRGVALTRTESTSELDTWVLTNNSALTVQLLEVVASGSIVGFGEETPVPLSGHNGLRFSYPPDEIWFSDWSSDATTPWSMLLLGPGDALKVHIPNNSTVLVRYRRDGFGGRFETRSVTVRGTV